MAFPAWYVIDDELTLFVAEIVCEAFFVAFPLEESSVGLTKLRFAG